MFVELTDTESTGANDWLMRDFTLAWRAFGKVIGVHVDDPVIPMDGDGTQREPVTGRYFYLEQIYPDKAERNRYLSLGHAGCWEGGAIRSLWPLCSYISYSVHPDRPVVEFHGWHRPQTKSRLLTPNYEDRALMEQYERGGLRNDPYRSKKALAAKALIQRYGNENPFLRKENLSAMNILVAGMKRLVHAKGRKGRR